MFNHMTCDNIVQRIFTAYEINKRTLVPYNIYIDNNIAVVVVKMFIVLLQRPSIGKIGIENVCLIFQHQGTIERAHLHLPQRLQV